MRRQTSSAWKIDSLESSIFVISSLRILHLLNGLIMQEVAVLEGPDLKIFRGSMRPDPPRGSRLPALGPLFTNFLDTPLDDVCTGHRTRWCQERPRYVCKEVVEYVGNLRFVSYQGVALH